MVALDGLTLPAGWGSQEQGTRFTLVLKFPAQMLAGSWSLLNSPGHFNPMLPEHDLSQSVFFDL